MACQGPSDTVLLYEQKALTDSATQAACEMSKIIRDNGLWQKLTTPTKTWIVQHDRADAHRQAEENKKWEDACVAKERAKKRKKLLERFTPQERDLLDLD